ncbi:Error-prone DNA polymerase [compost metagenome]
MTYAELQVTTHCSFLRGASSAEELFLKASELGIEAIGVVDRNSLAGIVLALEASRATGLRLVVGCPLDLQDGMWVLVYPTDRLPHSRLTRLITLGKSRGGKNNCILYWDDVIAYSDRIIGIMVPDHGDDTCALQMRKLADVFGDRTYVSIWLRRRPNDQMRLHDFANMAERFQVKTVVTNDVLFHEPGKWRIQDEGGGVPKDIASKLAAMGSVGRILRCARRLDSCEIMNFSHEWTIYASRQMHRAYCTCTSIHPFPKGSRKLASTEPYWAVGS